MYQRNRTKILNWLNNKNNKLRNVVMDGIVQLIEEGIVPGKTDAMDELIHPVIRNWVSIERSGINFNGRFLPNSDMILKNLKLVCHLKLNLTSKNGYVRQQL
jgi:hypothetical protein